MNYKYRQLHRNLEWFTTNTDKKNERESKIPLNTTNLYEFIMVNFQAKLYRNIFCCDTTK